MTEKVGKIEVVIKGGQPWGFRLQTNSENRSTLTITEITPGGKAALHGELKVGDNVIKVNGIQCLSLEDALQLIDSAFRTLTLLVWRPSQCSEDAHNKALELDLKKYNKVSNFSSESYPASCHIYENLQDVSRGIVQKCNKTYTSQISTSNCKTMFGAVPNTINTNMNGGRKLKSTSEYFPPKLIMPNLYLRTSFDDKCGRESSYSSDTKWKSLSMSKEIQPDLKPFSVPRFSTNVKENCSNLYKKNYVPSVDFQVRNSLYQRSFNKHLFESSLRSSLDGWKDLTETQGCMYPNCQNQNQACKVHSPPERDNVNSACNPNKQIVRNQPTAQNLSQLPLKYDQITYENVEIFNNSKESTTAKHIKGLSAYEHFDQITYENVEIRNNSKESTTAKNIKGSSANAYYDQIMYENVELFSNSNESTTADKSVKASSLSEHYDQITYENVEIFSNSKESAKHIRASSVNGHSVSKDPSTNHCEIQLNEKNSISSNFAYADSLNSYNQKDGSISENNFSRIINYENVPNKNLYSLSSMEASIPDVHQNEVFEQPNFTSSVANVNGLTSSALYKLCNESSVNSTIGTNANEFCTGCDEDKLEEELIEIEKRYENSLDVSEPGCQTPPLPSPPPVCETEILETDEPLPPPPSLSLDGNIQQSVQEDTEIVQTIYANLEMLKIQCSVVSSGTQTTLQLRKNSTVKDFSDFGLQLPLPKLPQYTKDPLLQTQLESSGKFKSHSLETQFQNYASLIEKTVQNQEKKLSKNALSLPVTSAYFTTSVPKAKLLTQFTSKFEHKNMTFGKELSNEKEELLESIAKKLRILKQEKAALQEELKQNEELGNSLATKLENVATKSETQKFKLHVEELEKITNLLLSLSGRLARTENALLILPAESSEEKAVLEAKYYKLTQQHDEALNLQRNIEKRNNQVSLFLFKYLTEDELVDYDHFIHMKVKLLVDYKDLLEKIKLGEEQLYALKSSFNTNDDNEIKTDLCNNIYVL